MNMRTYKVTCLNCHESNKAIISEQEPGQFFVNLNDDHERNPDNIYIISSRYRKDMQFGWECACGNYSLLAPQESDEIDQLLPRGGESAIDKIKTSLKIPDDNKFKMEEL